MQNQTFRQSQVWRLRHSLGWSIDRISRQLGISKSAVSQLLRRTAPDPPAASAGRPRTPRRRIVRPISLSIISNA
jgi:predicted transcriptional regulator